MRCEWLITGDRGIFSMLITRFWASFFTILCVIVTIIAWIVSLTPLSKRIWPRSDTSSNALVRFRSWVVFLGKEYRDILTVTTIFVVRAQPIGVSVLQAIWMFRCAKNAVEKCPIPLFMWKDPQMDKYWSFWSLHYDFKTRDQKELKSILNAPGGTLHRFIKSPGTTRKPPLGMPAWSIQPQWSN